MPARSVSCAISGENGALSSSRIVSGSATSTLSICDSSALRLEPHRHVAVERELRGFRVERLAVVEFHVRPQLDRDGLSVRGRLVRERELRHDVEIVVDVEQLVAQRREHDAPDIRARLGRVENVGILGKADAQMALRQGGRCRDGGREQGAKQNACLHDDPPC